MSLKVCHMTSVHARYDMRIFMKECRSLAKAGYDVILLCADNKPDETKDGVKIKSIKFQPQNRIQRILGAKKVMLNAALEVDAEIYHFHDPELLPVGVELKKRKKKVIYDAHEDYPLNILTKQWIPKILRPLIKNIMLKYEEWCSKKFDCIISVTPQIIVRLSKVNINTLLITNYPLLTENTEYNDENPRENIICFAGVISPLRMHHNIINAIENTEGIRYVLAGDSTSYLKHLMSLPGWDKVDYVGRLTYPEVLALYNRAKVGIVIEDYEKVNYHNEGSLGVTKLFEYMQAGIPLICSDFKLHKEILYEYDCGICVNPRDVNEISEAIVYIVKHRDVAIKMGENGRRAIIEKYNWRTQEKVLLDFYGGL